MALVKSFGLLILLGLLALLTVHFTHSVYLPQRTVLQEQTDELQSLQRELQTLKSQEDVEHAALEQRLEAIEALLGVLKSAQPKDVKEAADAAANKAVATANKTKTKAAKRSKALWREDHTCGPTGSLPNGEPAQCNPKSDAPCCSPSGWCGGTVEHCSCPSCIDYRTAAKPPEPYNLESPKRIALVVPFRDRGTHLEKFRERIQSHIASWERKGIRHHWKVYVVEQFDEQLFNRGYLFNVGFQYATVDEKNTGQKFDCVVMHDIDILPTPVVDYGWCLYPNQLSGEIECWGWGVPYPDNVGGVVSLSPSHWRGINGFSNEYDGWGGEDDDLYLRLKANNLLKGGCHTWCKDKNKPTVPMVRRPPLGEGKMTCLHDGDHTPRQRAPQDAPMWQRLNSMKAGSKRWLNDGLSSLKFFSAGDALETQDRSWHQEAMVAKLEALREDVQMSAAREKDFVNELGEMRRKVEGRYEDLSAHLRHLDKDLRTSLREFRSDFFEENQSSEKCLQDFRSSIRDFRSDLDEQRESLKVVQETDLVKHLGDARQVLADLQEERSWHHEAMKKLRESREEQKKTYEEEVSDLDKRSENFRQMLQSALAMELDKRDQSLTKQTEELFEKLQSWTQGQLDAYLDQARLLDQDILDKLNPDFLLMKDQLERQVDSVNQIASQVPALVLGDAQVREECQIFRSDIGKLGDEMTHMGESLRAVLPWVDWLREPGLRSLEERLAALEHLLTEGRNSQDMQLLQRVSSFEKELLDQQRSTTELQAVCRKLPEDLESQRRKLLGLEVNQRKYLLSEELKTWRQDFDSIRVRLKRCEMNQLQEQKNLKICQENCSRYRKACEDIYAKCQQETLQRQGDSRNLKEYEDAYAKWRQDAVAWQQEQVRKLQGQK